MKILSMLFIFLTLVCARAATWYVDSGATGSSNGTSWTNAWTNPTQIARVAAGDTVYISGGPAGQTKTYVMTSPWFPISGTASNPITYQIGQDAAHNGTAIFATSSDWIDGVVTGVVVTGDAGDGNMHFQVSDGQNKYVADVYTNSDHVRIAYVNCGNQMDGFQMNGVTNVELDHCYLHKTGEAAGGDDHIMYVSCPATTWDSIKIHDNTFYSPRNASGGGDDFVQGAANGFSFYHNVCIGYKTNYQGGQHQDGIQPLGGNYIRCYGNYFQDIANYAVYGDAYYGDFNHFWIYNNIVVLADPALQASDPPQGIAVGEDGGAFSQMGRAPVFNDVVIANNIIDGYKGHASIALNNETPHPATYTNCLIENNISINGGGINSDGNFRTPQVNNVTLVASAGATNFSSYATNRTNNDYHLKSTASSLISHGTNLSSYFTTDKDGLGRPSSAAWDIGPFQYSSGSLRIAPVLTGSTPTPILTPPRRKLRVVPHS